MNIVRKLREKNVTIFILEVIIFWVIFFVNGYAWVHGFDKISDILKIILVIGMLGLVISVINTFRKVKRLGSKLMVLMLVVIQLLFLCFYIPKFEGYSSEGLYSINRKKEVNGSYYIFINSSSGYVKVKCERDIYEKLVVDKHVSYPFSYRSLYYDNENGVLQGSIDIANAFSNDTPTEPPVITITNANMQLDYIMAKKVWRDEVYGGEDPFKAMLLNVSLDKIRYLEIGSTIKLNFMNRPPCKISVSDILLDKTGKLVISENALLDDRFSSSSEIYSFVVSQNLASEISSYYEKNENIIRGLRVTATWGLKQCEYDFVIKTP